ncbi:MAG: sulfatase [Niabella sp.]
MIRPGFYRWVLIGLTFLFSSGQIDAQKTKPYNVLFIAVDDLKPVIGAYGDTIAKTPAMDELAAEGAVFLNNHCQQALCAPSRASLLTGLRPDRTKVWDLQTVPREANPSMISLPQYFRQNGYETIAFGKIFHLPSSGYGQDSASWSITYRPTQKKEYYNAQSKVSIECAEVGDTVYADGETSGLAIDYLLQYNGSKKEQPFFLAVGFKKPHLPFTAPKKYWDLYQRSAFSLPVITAHAIGAPDMAYTNWGELRSYTDIPDEGRLQPTKQLELIHGYYAAVSYVDKQIALIIEQLKKLELYENTIIVLWGDHGWHLGDHGQWTKHTNFEQATRAPLIIRAPQYKKAASIKNPTEFIDVFPTLCRLNGFPIPEDLDGMDLTPLLTGADTMLKEYAISQYPRGPKNKIMGYALRDQRYRLVVWVDGYFNSSKKFNDSSILKVELYDYYSDPLESKSLATYPSYRAVKNELLKKVKDFFDTQYRKINSLHD